MKNFGQLLFLIGLPLLFTSCGATDQVLLSTMEPSPVIMSSAIKKIGIINRSTIEEGMPSHSNLDRMVAAQEQWLDHKGRDAAMNGLFDELLKDKRFEEVKLLDSVPGHLKDFGSDTEISWSSVEALCNAYKVDAIFSLAFYDTETKISVKKTAVLQPNLMRVKVKVPGQEMTLETLIENGWRIYSPQNQEIIDEIVFNDQFVSSGKGVNAVEAYHDMGNRNETVLAKSRTTGSNYGQRLLPQINTVSRPYFVRGSEYFTRANDLAKADDWEGAKKLWEQGLESPKAKIRARSCHNMAVFNERSENLDEAIIWANKALDHHHNDTTLNYLNALKQRVSKKELLEQQLAQMQFSD